MSISLSPWKSFSTNLMQDFQTQYASNTALLNYLTGIFKPMVEAGGLGFNAQTLAAMRTGASDTTATQYQNAEKALQQNQALTQEAGLPSGVAEQQKEELAAAAAGQGATAQQNITLANEQQRQRNLEFATQGLSDVARQQNPLGYAAAADSAGNTEASLENANTQADANSFGGMLKRGLASGITKIATGGLGGALSGDFSSGITSALYG